MRPAARRLRLHDRISDRPHVGGQPGAAHLRRHERDHEGDDRMLALTPNRAGLAEADRKRLLYLWNATGAAVPDLCVHELFERQAAASPEAVASCTRIGASAIASSTGARTRS